MTDGPSFSRDGSGGRARLWIVGFDRARPGVCVVGAAVPPGGRRKTVCVFEPAVEMTSQITILPL